MIWLLLLASPEAALVDRFAGEYQHVGGESDRRAVEAAIDDVVKEMTWIVRGIARDRLKDSARIAKRLRIVRDCDRIRIAFDGRERETALGSPPVKIAGMSGGMLNYKLQIAGGSLVQRFEGDGGGQVNAIRVEGDQLIVKVTVFSKRLPSNLVYELRYARQPSSSIRGSSRAVATAGSR